MLYKKIVLVVLTVFLTACGGAAQQPATEITVDMNEFLFLPASITIPANQLVVLRFTNSGVQEHDFVIEKINVTDVEMEGASSGQHHMGSDTSEYDMHISTAAGGTSTLSFTATEPGTYKIFCSIQGHEIAGMSGELIVVSE